MVINLRQVFIWTKRTCQFGQKTAAEFLLLTLTIIVTCGIAAGICVISTNTITVLRNTAAVARTLALHGTCDHLRTAIYTDYWFGSRGQGRGRRRSRIVVRITRIVIVVISGITKTPELWIIARASRGTPRGAYFLRNTAGFLRLIVRRAVGVVNRNFAGSDSSNFKVLAMVFMTIA